ncbi:interferon-induced protein 44-like isoform X2 [Clupea harengus]|uniref:Interferon-induced protein 44-like isoform X2 n=1 Tax=Clupea harengus TaxID=7950 RepID=A0A8M1KUF6_CLUHA|nr:interferon-induced protein 44-like isoform X2 [Clupea harengus]
MKVVDCRWERVSSRTKQEFTSQLQDKRVKRDEDIVFKCNANNLEDVNVVWEKDGQRLYDGDGISISQSRTELSLRISKAKEKDEGKYTIRLSKASESVSHTVKVTVLELDQDWRSIGWGLNVDIKHNLEDLKLKNPQVKHLNFLLHGPVGAGKSSIINSIQSIFMNRVEVGALVAATTGKSFTLTYNSYQIKNIENKALPYVFSDIMGLEIANKEGSHPDDIINILKGHIREGTMFNSSCPVPEKDRNYNRSPTPSDKIHCLISVLPADKISLMEKNNLFEKMGEIRKKASGMDIPQVVFMTHVDSACPVVKDNLTRIYSSKNIKKKMQECSNLTGIPMTCIFPVKNYHEENKLDGNMDSLILDALESVVNFAESYVDRLYKLEH